MKCPTNTSPSTSARNPAASFSANSADAGITLTEAHRFPNLQIKVTHSQGETMHWDILRLWHDIKTGLAKIANEGHHVEGVAVDVWGVDFALLDEQAQLIGNPVCYRDPRTDGMVDAVFAKLSKEKIYAATGIQTMALNTLFQLAALSFKKSPQLPRTKHILFFLPDLFSYWLPPAKWAPNIPSRQPPKCSTPAPANWSPEVLAAIGIDPALFPPIQFPGGPQLHPRMKRSSPAAQRKTRRPKRQSDRRRIPRHRLRRRRRPRHR